MPTPLRLFPAALLALALPAMAGQNTWTALGPADAKVSSLAVSPASRDILYAGFWAASARSTDRGVTWTQVSTPYTTYSLAIDPQDPNRILGGTSAALGVSTDGGATFALRLSVQTNAVVFDPKDPNIVYAGARFGFFRSTDRGDTWVETSTGLGSRPDVLAITVHPVQTNVLYAALWGGVYKSGDGGRTWSATPMTGIVRAVAVDPVHPEIVMASSPGVGIYRSTDGGATWTSVSTQGSCNALLSEPATPGTFYAATSQGFFVSQNSGASWSSLSFGLTDNDVRALAVDPSERTRIYAGTDGAGVFAIDISGAAPPSITVTSPNGGEVWQAGSTHTISWTSTGTIAKVKIEFSSGGSWGGFSPVASDLPNSGSYSWTFPSANSPNCFVKVSDMAGTCSDTSDAAFTVSRCPMVGIVPFSATFGAAGGTGTVAVSAQPGCSWSTTSTVPWISVTLGSSGFGNGTVTYSVAPNSGPERVGTLSISGQTFTVTQSAGSSAGEVVLFVPVVLDVLGAHGSHFTSELTLTNRGSADAAVRLTYTGSADLCGGSGSAPLVLPAGRQMILRDAIAELKALGVSIPDSGNRGGTLEVGFSGLASPSDGGVTVRTTTAVENGRAGLAYAGVPAAKRLNGPALICGLRENASDRSNVALQNAGAASDGDITLRVTVRSGDTDASVTLPDITLSPGGFRQISAILGANGMTNGWVRVERVAGTAPYSAYGVINDNVNSDGSFIPAQTETGSSPQGLTIPVVVEASVYTSELVLTNVDSSPKNITLTLVADAVDTPEYSTAVSVVVGGGRQVVISNVLDAFRAQGAPGIGSSASYAGALFVSVANGDCAGLVAGVRTSAPGGGGRYGLFYPAVPSGQASSSIAWLYGLRQDAENRTNVALVNTGETGSTDDVFAIDLYDGDSGQLVHTENGVTLGSRRWRQFDAALSVWAPWVSQGYVNVRRVSGANPFVTYAVVNDGGVPQQRSDDGAFVASSE